MVRVHGIVLEDERMGRKAERCKGIGLTDDAGNLVGQIWFDSTDEIRLQLDPRFRITIEAGGKEIKREMSPYRVGSYFEPAIPTVENNLDIIQRHQEKLYGEGINFDKATRRHGKAYPWRTRSR